MLYQNQLFQYSGFDITAIALFSIFTMRRTYKVVRVLFRDIAAAKVHSMSKTYEDEQSELKKQIQSLRVEIDQQGQQMDNLDRFIQMASKYVDLQQLTPYALRELVKGI